MSYFFSNNLKLSYQTAGSGEPLVLIAGITCDNQHWSLIKEQLSKYFWLIMPDNRGVGKSETPNVDYEISDMAQDIITLLEHLNISKTHILGHSLGGAVAQYLAAFHPEKVNKLIISHSFVKFRPSSIMFCEHDYLLQESRAAPMARATGILPFIYSDEFINDSGNVESFIQNISASKNQQSLHSYKQQIKVISKFDSTDYLHNVSAETLVVSGKSDKLAPPQDSIQIIQKISHAQHQEIKGAHVPMWEIPETYIDIIKKFLTTM
ncbi:MAG: alpha/beta hydrolase [Neisseriaceae bacterium]|nr:MAG: alpha/beta hydrolase [Neisseriaceae bacterium]